MEEPQTSDEVRLRPLCAADEGAVRELLTATFPDKTAAMAPRDPVAAAAVMAELATHCTGWVAEAGDRVVGLLLLWESEEVRHAKADWGAVRRRLPRRAAPRAWLFLLAFYWIRFPDDCLLIDTLAVLPAWQRRGVARRLLRLAIDEARRLRRRAVRLYCLPTNTRAHTLYERFGFCVLRREHYRFSGWLLGFDRSDYMELSLEATDRS